MSSIKNGKIYGGKHNRNAGLSTEGMTPREISMADHEGFVPEVYKDTEGYKTIGIGHKLTDEEIKTQTINGKPIKDLDHKDLLNLYRQDITKHDRDTERLVRSKGIDMKSLPEDAQDVLKEMGFNMGATTLGTFTKMFKALKAGDYKEAQKEALNSDWATQVKGRANKLAAKLGSADVQKAEEQPREPAGSFNPSEVSFSLMPDESPKDPKRVSDAEFDLAVEDAGFGDEPVVEEKAEVIPAEEPAKEEEEASVNIPETFEPMDLASSVNMSKAPVEDVPEFAKEEPVQSKDSEFLPSVKVDLPEAKEELPTEELPEVKLEEEPESVSAEVEKQERPSVEKIRAEKIVGDKLDKGLPGIDYIVDSKLVPEEMWKTKDLEEIAGVMNESIRNKRRAIDQQFKRDRNEKQKDKWIIALALGLQAFANGMAAQAQAVPDRIVNGRLVRGRPAGKVKQVDFSILKELEDDIKDKRAYRMKRAGLTLSDAKFRFKLLKDERDLGLRQEKDRTKTQEKARLEGKKDAEKLDKQQTSLAKDEFKRESKSVDSVLKDVKGQKRDNKVRQTAVDSIIANMGKTREEAEEMVQDRNFLGKLTDSDLFGLGLSDLDRTELLEKLAKEKPSTDSIKPTTKRSDSLYDPKIHYLGKAADGKTYIYRKDNDQGVAEYGKQ